MSNGGRYRGPDRRQGYAEMTAMIAEEPDPKLRALLAAISAMFGRLEEKLDVALADEQALRQMVLNGHSDTHSDDHDHVAKCRAGGCLEVCEKMRERIDSEEKDADVTRGEQIKQKFSIRTAAWSTAIGAAITFIVSNLVKRV